MANFRTGMSVTVLLFLAACSGSEAPRIVAVYGDAASTRIEVGVDTCNLNPVVLAQETTSEVRLSVTADEPSGDGAEDCADSDWVRLESPLGDRVVIEDSTGEQLEVLPNEE